MPDLPPPLPSQEQVISALADCGLDRAGISIAYDNDVQSDVVRIKVIARATDQQFACINAATQGSMASFEDTGQDNAYSAYVAALMRPRMIADARNQLAAAGKLKGMPIFGQFPDAASFFRAVEVHCGVKPGLAFKEVGAGEWSLLPQGSGAKDFERLTCLIGVWMAQDEDWSARGLSFGFIGNEAFSEQ